MTNEDIIKKVVEDDKLILRTEALEMIEMAREDERMRRPIPLTKVFEAPLGTEESREVWKRIFTVAGYVILKPTE